MVHNELQVSDPSPSPPKRRYQNEVLFHNLQDFVKLAKLPKIKKGNSLYSEIGTGGLGFRTCISIMVMKDQIENYKQMFVLQHTANCKHHAMTVPLISIKLPGGSKSSAPRQQSPFLHSTISKEPETKLHVKFKTPI